MLPAFARARPRTHASDCSAASPDAHGHGHGHGRRAPPRPVFARAGSSASHYCDWEAKVGEGVELCAVQLPGREARRCEDVPPTLQDAAYDFVAACRELFENGEVPYAFFGHSSGTWMAYEVCRELRRLGMVRAVGGGHAGALRARCARSAGVRSSASSPPSPEALLTIHVRTGTVLGAIHFNHHQTSPLSSLSSAIRRC